MKIPDKIKGSFHPYAFAAILLWATAFVYTRLALQYFSALPLGFLRYFVSAATMLIIMLIKKTAPPKRRDIPWFLLSGASGFGVYTILFNAGTSYVTAATSSVILSVGPVFTALLAFFVFREKLSRLQWLAIAVEFSGIVVFNVRGGVFALNTGVIMLLAAALLLSVYNLMQRALTGRYTSFEKAAYSMIAGALILCVFAPSSVKEAALAPLSAHLIIVWLGVMPGALAFILWGRALEKSEKISHAANYMFFTPVITGILGILIAREFPDSYTLLGGGIILMGALLFNWGGAIMNTLSAKAKTGIHSIHKE